MKTLQQTALRRITGLLLILSMCMPVGASAQRGNQERPDSLIEASTLAAHADSLAKSCVYKDAEQWQKRAIEVAKAGRYSTPADRDTAGALVGRLQVGLAEMQDTRRRLDAAATEIPRLMKVRRLTSAGSRLLDVDPLSCDPRLQAIQRELSEQVATARDFVREGNEHLRNQDGRRALAAFEQAQAINREEPDLENRILAARNMKRAQSHTGARIAKAALAIAVAGGLGAAGYLEYQNRQKTTTAH